MIVFWDVVLQDQTPCAPCVRTPRCSLTPFLFRIQDKPNLFIEGEFCAWFMLNC